MKKHLLVFSTLLITHAATCQVTLWLENFENSCSSGCTSYTGTNGAWSFINSPASPAGLCGYGGANGASSNRWYVSCAEDGKSNGVCGSGCGSNESLHMGSATLGDLGAAYDASQTTCKMAVSPSINTTAAGTNTKTVTFEYIRYGQGTTDCAQLLYSTDNGSTWNFLANPIPIVTCCSGACSGQDQGVWTTVNYTLPASCDNITTLKLGFNWKNNNSAGSDPSFAVNDFRVTYNSTLPVELISFTGHPKNKMVELEWTTASETNAAYFDIERSVDGNEFTFIGRENSKGNNGNGHRVYKVLDKDPVHNTAYYRLKQVDLDGTATFSGLISVDYSDATVEPLQLNALFTDASLIVLLNSDEERSISLEIFDVQGRLVLKKQYHLTQGSNKVTLSSAEFASSSYVIRASDVSKSAFSYSHKAVRSAR